MGKGLPPEDFDALWYSRVRYWPWLDEQLIEDMTPGANDERWGESSPRDEKREAA